MWYSLLPAKYCLIIHLIPLPSESIIASFPSIPSRNVGIKLCITPFSPSAADCAPPKYASARPLLSVGAKPAGTSDKFTENTPLFVMPSKEFIATLPTAESKVSLRKFDLQGKYALNPKAVFTISSACAAGGIKQTKAATIARMVLFIVFCHSKIGLHRLPFSTLHNDVSWDGKGRLFCFSRVIAFGRQAIAENDAIGDIAAAMIARCRIAKRVEAEARHVILGFLYALVAGFHKVLVCTRANIGRKRQRFMCATR
jgi:hypothetical protein